VAVGARRTDRCQQIETQQDRDAGLGLPSPAAPLVDETIDNG
jgi:hypothetical protein